MWVYLDIEQVVETANSALGRVSPFAEPTNIDFYFCPLIIIALTRIIMMTVDIALMALGLLDSFTLALPNGA